MKEYSIGNNEQGQRLDKLLAKILNQATKGFIYKMLRKKNITLNGKKATGNEMLKNGDIVKIFLSDETFEKFAFGTVNNFNNNNDNTKDIIETIKDGNLGTKPVLKYSIKTGIPNIKEIVKNTIEQTVKNNLGLYSLTNSLIVFITIIPSL